MQTSATPLLNPLFFSFTQTKLSVSRPRLQVAENIMFRHCADKTGNLEILFSATCSLGLLTLSLV